MAGSSLWPRLNTVEAISIRMTAPRPHLRKGVAPRPSPVSLTVLQWREMMKWCHVDEILLLTHLLAGRWVSSSRAGCCLPRWPSPQPPPRYPLWPRAWLGSRWPSPPLTPHWGHCSADQGRSGERARKLINLPSSTLSGCVVMWEQISLLMGSLVT